MDRDQAAEDVQDGVKYLHILGKTACEKSRSNPTKLPMTNR